MLSTPHFSLRVTPAESLSLIVSISKKVSKKAVIRNRIRRRARPILRELTLGFTPATYMVVVKPGAENVRGLELRNELALLIKKS
jgi:ribonuclease P protein component